MFVTVRQPLAPEPSFWNVPTPRPTLAKDGPASMEVNRAQPKGGYPIVCHCCNQTGHYARSCPQSYDVQTMTIEERLELLPELLALANNSDTPNHEGLPAHKVEENSEPEAHMKEGFGTSSG